jgi:hypothetical protein
VLLSLASGGSLPWSNAVSEADMRRLRQSTNIFNYAASVGCPEVNTVSAHEYFCT